MDQDAAGLAGLAYVALGMLGGVFVTAPLGPVNVMIMQRSFRYGFGSGLSAGVGASLADIVFATAAAFGISAIGAFIEGHSRLIQLAGGLLVIVFGARILWRQPVMSTTLPVETRRKSAVEIGAGTFFLTITSPATIFGFVAYFSALGEWGPDQGDVLGTIELVLGVAIGTLGWWCGLAAVVTRLRLRFTEATLARVNLIAGMMLVFFGAMILGRLSVTFFGLI